MRRIAPGWWAAAAAVLAYAPALPAGLVFDDLSLYAANGYFTDPASFGALVGPGYWASGELTWRPVATLTHLLDTVPFGAPCPPLAHGVNVALHALAAALLATLARALLGGFAVPLAAGLVLAWHPGPSEAVVVVTYREDLLAAVGMLGALLAALRAWRGPGGRGAVAASLAGAAVALGAKETALCLPLLVAGLAWHVRPVPGRRALGLVVAHAGLALAYAVVRFGLLRHPEESDAAFPLPAGWLPPLCTGLRVLGEDLRLLALPLALSVDPWPPTIAGPLDGRLAWPLLAVAAVVALALGLRRHPLLAGSLWATLLLLAPTLPWSGIANLRADRFVYLPLAAMGLAAAAGVRAVVALRPGWRRGTAGATALLAVAALARLEWRLPDFADDGRLWEATLATDPTSVRARLEVGHRRVEAGRVEEGLALMREGVALRPEHVHPHLRLGETLLGLAAARRDPALRAEADAAFRAALERKPHWGLLHARLGDTARAFGEAETAIRHYREGLAVEPRQPAIAGALGTLLLAQGDRAEARSWLEVAIAAGADTVEVLWNGAELRRQAGDLAGAAVLYARLVGRAGAPAQLADRLRAVGHGR
jgi:tetratricopeptide (TPR) repeat protein